MTATAAARPRGGEDGSARSITGARINASSTDTSMTASTSSPQ